MKITILGCGSSGGVPLIGNEWGECDPSDPRNRRTRASVLVEEGDQTFLIDTSPDMRQQLLSCNLKKLDAVFYTHAHADHCHGIDELRSVNWLTKKSVDVYADPATMKDLEARFPYIFKGTGSSGFYSPAITPHFIEKAFTLGNVRITPYWQNHGPFKTLGFRFNDFAYSTDVNELDQEAFAALEGVKIWVVDCVRETPHRTHAHLTRSLEWIEHVKPKQAYLTHMNDSLDYAKLAAKLPPGVAPAYDGLVIAC